MSKNGYGVATAPPNKYLSLTSIAHPDDAAENGSDSRMMVGCGDIMWVRIGMGRGGSRGGFFHGITIERTSPVQHVYYIFSITVVHVKRVFIISFQFIPYNI